MEFGETNLFKNDNPSILCGLFQSPIVEPFAHVDRCHRRGLMTHNQSTPVSGECPLRCTVRFHKGLEHALLLL